MVEKEKGDKYGNDGVDDEVVLVDFMVKWGQLFYFFFV